MINRQSLAEQTAAHLIREMNAGQWSGELPGVNRLAVELGVSRETVRAALGLVEKQGLLLPRGSGRAREILTGKGGRVARKSLRVMILLHERIQSDTCNAQNFLNQLKHQIEEAGHHCLFSSKCQTDMGLDAARIIRFVERTPADAWVVISGSLELLQWFSCYSVPTITVGGRNLGLPIASSGLSVLLACRHAFRHLIGIGHRRIVMIVPQLRRQPSLSAIERTLQDELASHGLAFGDYNVPDWEPTSEGLDALLTTLFRLTPPTALQVGSPNVALGVLSFLNRSGLRVPEDVSLICETMDNTLAWYRPVIAHFTVDYDFIVRQVLRWVKAVADGIDDRKRSSYLAEFVQGETIRPPKGGDQTPIPPIR